MHSQQSYAVRKQLIIYFLITSIGTWICWIPFVLNITFTSASTGQATQQQNPLMILQLIGNIIPSLIGFILLKKYKATTYQINEEIQPKWKNIKIPFYLLVLSIGIPFLLYFSGILITSFTKDISSLTISSLIAAVVSLTIIAGLGEEIGWRGFALPRLLTLTTPLKASLILNILWGLWHLPIHLWSFSSSDTPLVLQLISALLTLVGIGCIMTYLYIKTKGNLFWMVIFHGLITGLSTVTLPLLPEYIPLVVIPSLALTIGLLLLRSLYSEQDKLI